MMDISLVDDEPRGANGRRTHRATIVRKAFGVIGRTLLKIVRICLYNPLSGRPFGSRFRNDDGSAIGRFIKGLSYRLAFVPLFAALAACAFVYSGTHPRPIVSELDPSSVGIYYEAINLKTDDNVRLDAWLVPAIEATKVLDQKEKILRDRRPAVILLHDFAERRQQMLPLVRPLHDAGFVVLVPAMRGCGTSQSAGQTFGLRESLDVKAAIDLLRKRNFVDPNRISLIGVGSGANAAMIAAQKDSRVLAMVLERPNQNLNEVIIEHVAPRQSWLTWLRPLCKWTFEIAYEADAEEFIASRDATKKREGGVLMLHNASADSWSSKEQVANISHFLKLRSEEKLLKRSATEVKPLAGAN